MTLQGHSQPPLNNHSDWERNLRTGGRKVSLLSSEGQEGGRDKKVAPGNYVHLISLNLIRGKVMEQLILETFPGTRKTKG